MSRRRRIPEATVARLPVYLRVLTELAGIAEVPGAAAGGHRAAPPAGGAPGAGLDRTVSSEQLAELAGVNAAKVRKDLSYLGSYGTRGVGYEVDHLVFQVRRELGLTHEWPCVIVGMGNLGQALAGYGGLGERGFVVRALVDVDSAKVGRRIHGLAISSAEQLGSVVREREILIGIVATPAPAAQEVADRLIAAGVRAILNFAPTMLHVPEEVSLRQVDLALELQILSFYQEQQGNWSRSAESGKLVSAPGPTGTRPGAKVP